MQCYTHIILYQALQGLQKLKLSAQKEIQIEKTQQMLAQMAMPHIWQLSKGEATKVCIILICSLNTYIHSFDANMILIGIYTRDTKSKRIIGSFQCIKCSFAWYGIYLKPNLFVLKYVLNPIYLY